VRWLKCKAKMDVGRSFSFGYQLQSKRVRCLGVLMSAKRVNVFKDTVQVGRWSGSTAYSRNAPDEVIDYLRNEN
jgi:hypothetical protein